MSTELELSTIGLDEKVAWAKAIAPSALLPKSYQGHPESVLVALEYGAALGMNPMVAINSIHIISGRPTLSAGLVAALVRRDGHRMRTWVDYDDNGAAVSATTTISRRDDPDFEFTSTWTLARAKDAQLLSNDMWKKYPANMMKARSITECARDAVPEALNGMGYTAEELGGDDKGGTTLVEVGPVEKPVRLADRARRAAKPEPEPVHIPDDTTEFIEMVNGTDDLGILRGWYKDWTSPEIRAAILARVDFVKAQQQGEPVDADVIDAFPEATA